MKNKLDKTLILNSRRLFIKGAGGALLALPLLPSIMGDMAYAQAQSNNKFFISMFNEHGGLADENWRPQNVNNNIIKEAAIGGKCNWNLNYFSLTDYINGGMSSSLSNAIGTELNPYLDKVNMIEGVHMTWHYHNSGLLGNYHIKAGGHAFPTNNNHKYNTIDHLLAHHPKFYGTYTPQEKIMIINHGRGKWSHYFDDSGNEVYYNSSGSRIKYLFNKMFPNNMAASSNISNNEIPDSVLKRKSIVDRVLASYNRVVSGSYGVGKIISYEDKQIFEEHINHLREIEKKIDRTISSVGNVACGSFNTGIDNDSSVNVGSENTYTEEVDKIVSDLITDIIVASVKCGQSRLATIALNYCNTYRVGSFHPDIAHQHSDPIIQAEILKNNQRMCKHMFASLVAKLDAVKLTEGSLLDNGLVFWSQEFGPNTHLGHNMRILTAGGSGGFFNTGNYINLHNENAIVMKKKDVSNYREESDWTSYMGISYNRWLAHILMSMGLDPVDFERYGNKGYGHPYISDSHGVYNGPSFEEISVDNSKTIPILVKT